MLICGATVIAAYAQVRLTHSIPPTAGSGAPPHAGFLKAQLASGYF